MGRPRAEAHGAGKLQRSELDLGALALEVGTTLAGRVVDEAGAPIPGAEIARFGQLDFTRRLRIDWDGVVLARSAADGSFRIDTLALGPTKLEVHAPGFVRRRREVYAEGGSLREWRVELQRAAPITGRVVGGPPDVELAVDTWVPSERERHHVSCAKDGSFVIDGLAPENEPLHLWAMKRRGDAADVLGELSSSEWQTISPSVPAHPGARDVEIRVPASVTYRIRVVDAGTGEPLSDVHLGLLEGFDFESGRKLDVRAESDGVYTTSLQLPENPLALVVAHPGHQRVALGEIPFLPGETRDFGVVALERLAPTRVRVVSDSDGRPVAGAEVTATIDYHDEGCGNAHMPGIWPMRKDLPDGWSGTTDADGTTSAYLSSGPDYWITVLHPEHAPLWHHLDPDAAPPDELELRLLRGGTITVQHFDSATLAPLAHRLVRYEMDDWRRDEKTTGDDGRVVFEHLAPGHYRFWPDDGDDDTDSVVAQVTDGSALELELRLGRESIVRLHGRITEHGVPLAGARVATWSGETTTDRDGRYEFPEMEAGEDQFTLTHPRHGPIWVQQLDLLAPEATVDVDLTPARLEGVVRDESGTPLAGAKLCIATRHDDGRFEAIGTWQGPLHATESASDGSFALPAAQPSARCFLLVSKAGFQTERLGPLVFPLDGSPLVFAPMLRRALELDVIVRGIDRSAHVVRSVVARWRGDDELEPDDRELEAEQRPGTPDELFFHFPCLRPGPWEVEVLDFLSQDDRPLARTEVTLEVGRTEPLVLRP